MSKQECGEFGGKSNSVFSNAFASYRGNTFLIIKKFSICSNFPDFHF